MTVVRPVTDGFSYLSVTDDGKGVRLAGAVAVRLLADRVGLTGGLSTALAGGTSPIGMTAVRCW